MGSVNERLLDEAIHHAIDLTRYSNGVVRRMIAVLNRMDAELVAAITQALLQMPEGGFSIDRLEMLLGSARQINAEAIRQVFGELPGELQRFTVYEAGYQSKALLAAYPSDARALIQFQRVTPEQVYAAALSRPFQGGLLREWQASVEAGRMKQVRDAIRQGFVQGESTDQIVRRIRGTRAKQFNDGILQRSRRDIESVVRTVVAHTAETARTEAYKANDDLIKALKWVSTLDSRTSPMCRIRDGKQYTVEDHKPIGHNIPWGQGPGRLHWCCRSCSAPVTKSWRELGIDMDELDPSTRASMDGQVAAETTYNQWLKRQPAARQDEILGPTRGALLRKGGMTAEEMYSNRGDFLTLDQLRAKDAAAFERAGLQSEP
jgi:SPP1 gp7 family putative phage head morphogenesis protein